VALTLVATGPLVGGLWLGVLSASNLTAPLGTPPWRWPIVHLGGWPARLVLALVVTTVLTAWLTVAATGKLTRWLPARLRRPGIAAATTATGTIIVDAALLITLAVHALPTPTSTATGGLLVVAAATASLVRGAVAGRAARRCLGAHRIPN
jgi:hypothetical protein